MTFNQLLYLFILFLFLLFALALIVNYSKISKLKRYKMIDLGMKESEMLSIMGTGYNRSLLKNNRTKYEWRIRATSHGVSHNGVSSRSYSGVKKVDIYTKDGYVEEVRPYNV